MAGALPVTANSQQGGTAPAAQFADLISSIAQLTAAVRDLRAELAQQRLSRQEETIRALERQLEALRTEQVRLDDEERSNGRELQEVSERLSRAPIGNDERLQLEAVRAALTSLPERLGTERSSIAQRETRLLEQLAREQRRHVESAAAAKEPRPEPAPTR
jgi:hypothetical protein